MCDLMEMIRKLNDLGFDVTCLHDEAVLIAEAWERVQEMFRQIDRFMNDLIVSFADYSDRETDPQVPGYPRRQKGSWRNIQRRLDVVPWYTSGYQ